MAAVDGSNLTARKRLRMPLRIGLMAGLLGVAACGSTVAGTANPATQASSGQAQAAAANPDLDPGTLTGRSSGRASGWSASSVSRRHSASSAARS